MKDKVSVERLNHLHPKSKEVFSKFIEDAEAGLNIILRISQGLRTIAQQDALYAQGRTAAGKIVRNAKGGSSYHNYGLAIDVGEVKAGGSVNWNFDYKTMLPYAKQSGLEWGGLWKTIIDKPHSQISFGFSEKNLFALQKDSNGYPIF